MSTLNTNTQCWMAGPGFVGAGNVACSFRRRAIEDTPLKGVDEVERLIRPSSVAKNEDEVEIEQEIESVSCLVRQWGVII